MIAQFRQAAQGLTQFASAASRASQSVNGLRTGVRNAAGSITSLRAPTSAADRELTKMRNSGRIAASSLQGVTAPANQASRGLDGVRKSAQAADGAMGRIRGSAAGAGGGLNQVRNQAAQADGAFARTRGGADTFNKSLDGLKGSADRGRDSLQAVKGRADDVERSVGLAGKTASGGKSLFGDLASGLTGAKGAQEGLNGAFKASAIGAVIALVLPLIEHFGGLEGIAQRLGPVVMGAFQNIRDGLGPIMEAIKTIISVPLRVFFSGINAAIEILNKIKVTVPGWVPGIGGKKFGIDIPPFNPPLLAEGGIVSARSGGTLAVIGEGREAEAVIPLSKLDSMLRRDGRAGAADRDLLNELLLAVRSLAAQPVVVAVDGQVIARATRLGERQLARR